MNSSSDSGCVLTLAEMIAPRTPGEWVIWVATIEQNLSSTHELVRESRRRTGLLKYFYDELFPLSLFAEAYGRFSPDARIVWLHDRDKGQNNHFDAVLHVPSEREERARTIEISLACAGYSDSLRREELNRVGHVGGIGEVRVLGARNSRRIHAPVIAVRRELPRAHALSLIRDCIHRKSKDRYRGVDILLVGFDDSSFDETDISLLRDWCNHYVLPRSLPPFTELWLVGMRRTVSLCIDLRCQRER